MDFYKSRNSNSTSSNHSNTNSSHKSHASSNGGAVYNLEYCTSSSSMSPLASVYALSAAANAVKRRTTDDVIAPSSGGSTNSSRSSCSSNKCSSQYATKRRHTPSVNLDDKDPELGLEPPSAKRQQRVPSLYQSDPGSVVSSVYPSPIDELVDEIDTHSSVECLSTANEYNVAPDDIPESPNSLVNADGSDHENSIEDDDEIVSGTTSPSTCSNASSKKSDSYIPLHLTPAPTCNPATPSVVQVKVKSFDEYLNAHYDCLTPAAEPEPLRQCPLPALSWANAHDVWQLMCKKDEQTACLRDSTMLEDHPGLQPRMRAILLDWLIEVCEVYKLHRETYYLAVDYLDRYLNAQKKVQKTHLQLIGITCLFVAAKVEEIYPPKIGEFAYVTDGACQERDILQHEILLLQALEWNISPVTPMGWLGVYMQLNVNNRTTATLDAIKKVAKKEADEAFIYPQFSGMEFAQTAQLLDLCSLDVGIGNFPYSVIAAAAMSHTFNRETAVRCSGLNWQKIRPCALWMAPFFDVICLESGHLYLLEQNEQIVTKFGLGHICPNIVTDDSHIIQTHTTTMIMFDRACLLREEQYAVATKKQEASPGIGLVCPEGLLTPPASSRKPLGAVDEEDEDVDGDGDDGNVKSNEVAVIAAAATTAVDDVN